MKSAAKALIASLLGMALSIGAWAASPVKVVVKDSQGFLPGVSIVVQGTIQGAVTDINGEATLSDVPGDATLVISFYGYRTIEEKVASRAVITVLMVEDNIQLEESVVVGYGSTRKVNLTGAVEAVGEEQFANRSVVNAAKALEGAVPNLNITFSDGKEGRAPSINVRGTTSVGQGGSALVLIDGVEGDISLVNPADIESVTVLKDAASAAVYGARGTYGVVLVTTKAPEKGKASVTYSANFSMKAPTMLPDNVTDGVEYLELMRLSYFNRKGTSPTTLNLHPYSDAYLAEFKARREAGITAVYDVAADGTYTYYGSTDWYDLLYKDQSFSQEHNITIKGGSDRSTYYLSGRFYGFDGIYNYDPDTFKSWNLRSKGTLKVNEWLSASSNFEYSRSQNHTPISARGNSLPRYIELMSMPNLVPFNPDGTLSMAGAYSIGTLVEGNNFKEMTYNQMKASGGVDAHFFGGRLKFIGDFTVRYRNEFRTHKQMYVNYSSKEGKTSVLEPDKNSFGERNIHSIYTVANAYAQYEDTFASNHYLKVMAGYNWEHSDTYNAFVSRNELLLPDANTIGLAMGQDITTTAAGSEWALMGIFYRLNYSYKDRYLVEFNGRYDGLSKFPTNQQYAFFPSVSAGWRVSQEGWWHVNPQIIKSLKLRASYGSLGNGNIDPYKFIEQFKTSTSNRYINGSQNKYLDAPDIIPNNLTWETATTADAGLDVSFLKGRLELTGDVYVRRTTDMYTTGPTLPDVYGGASPKGNYAKMTTRGWEVSLGWNDRFNLCGKPFSYGIKAALYDYTAVIDEFNNLTGEISDYYPGYQIGQIWGFTTDGFFQSIDELIGYTNTEMTAPSGSWQIGDLKFKDLNDDGRIDRGKRTVEDHGDYSIIGNSNPRYQYSFSFNADWNGIFVNAMFTGVGHQDWYPGKESPFWGQYNRQYNNVPKWHVGNFWTSENPDAYLPRYATNNSTVVWNNYKNDRYLQNIAYIRLKSLQAGYNLPTKLIRKAAIQNARIYLTGENLWSWSPMYRHTGKSLDVFTAKASKDADFSNVDTGDGNGYPLLRSVSLGLSITF